MISDTLSEAIAEIDDYTSDPAFGYDTDPSVRAWIASVRGSMNDLRVFLDSAGRLMRQATPPDVLGPYVPTPQGNASAPAAGAEDPDVEYVPGPLE